VAGRQASLIIGMLLLITGCGIGTHLSTWNYQNQALSYHHHSYRVTHAVLSSVGRKIGIISFHGRASGVFNLYAVPGHAVRQEIAVHAHQGYLKAIAVNH
jgi:hypothetical protein